MSGWDYPDFRDEEPLEEREFWEDDVPDSWWADWNSEAQDEQYERSAPYELRLLLLPQSAAP